MFYSANTNRGLVSVRVVERRKYGRSTATWVCASIGGVDLDLFQEPWPGVVWPRSAVVWELRTMFPEIQPNSADIRWLNKMRRERRFIVASESDRLEYTGGAPA